MISPNISMVPLRLPMNGEPRGPAHKISTGLSTSPRSSSEPHTSKSKTTPAKIKMTNFSIAAIMNNGQPNNEILKINQNKLEQSLGKRPFNSKWLITTQYFNEIILY